MGDSKRWTVTYTKHIKQKRKVYQDGSLEHHGNKVMLYDDTDKLIDSRFMKKDEIVECGGTLTFDGYLVDIGDPQGNHGVLKDVNVQGMDKKLSERISTSHESKRIDAGNDGASQYRLNLSKNIKKEDEKNEFQQFGAPNSHLRLNGTKTTERGSKPYTLQMNEAVQSHSNSPQSNAREWQALYTTQITQKAKRYHDGILRIEFRGSHQKQVMLYDASRNLLESRFLKKDEIVESGETVIFGAHLVDVGDPEASPHDCMVVPSRHGNVVGGAGLVKSSAGAERTGMLHELKTRYNSSFVDKKDIELANAEERQFPKEKAEERMDSSNLMQDNLREWHAVYTTQVTQKAKKYHDGFLQLTFCVSQRKQVILLSEDRTVLSKKYLNSSADVRAGSTLQLTNYLVEIGEPHIVQGGEPQNDASSGKHLGSYSSSLTDKIRFSVSDSRNKPIQASVEEPQNDASSRKHAGSSSSSLTVEEIKFSASDSRNKPTHDRDKLNKPIRDVLQIISTLRKPIAPESLAPTRKPSLEQICSSQSSDSFHFGFKEKSFGQNAQDPEVLSPSALACHNDDPGNVNGDCVTQMRSHRSEISQCRAAQNISNLMGPDHNEELQSDTIRSGVSLGAASSNIPTSKSNLGYPGKSTGRPYSSISESQVSDVILDLPDKRMLNSYSSAAESQVSEVAVLDLPDESTAKSHSSITECQVSNVLVLDSPEDAQQQGTSMKHNGLMETSQIMESHLFRSSEGSSCNESRNSKHVQDKNSNQVRITTCLGKMETSTRREESFRSGLSSSSGSASFYFNDATERENLETLKDTPKDTENFDEYPSFDLGI